MKTLIICIFFLTIYNIVNAQFYGPCIKLLQIDFDLLICKDRTVVEKITTDGNKFLVQTSKDNKKYNFSIDTEGSFEFRTFIKIGSRVTYIAENKTRSITVATMSGENVDVKKYKICD